MQLHHGGPGGINSLKGTVKCCSQVTGRKASPLTAGRHTLPGFPATLHSEEASVLQ